MRIQSNSLPSEAILPILGREIIMFKLRLAAVFLAMLEMTFGHSALQGADKWTEEEQPPEHLVVKISAEVSAALAAIARASHDNDVKQGTRVAHANMIRLAKRSITHKIGGAPWGGPSPLRRAERCRCPTGGR